MSAQPGPRAKPGPPTDRVVRFRGFGPVEVIVGDAPLAIGPPRQAHLLAILMAEAGRPVTIDAIIGRLWGEDPPGGARHTLYAYVARLRQALSGGAVQAGAKPVAIVRRSSGYALDTDPGSVDLLRFRELITRAGAQRAELLDEALRLCTGPAFAGIGGDWAATVREGFERQRVATTVTWAELALAAGSGAAAVDRLSDLHTEHPLAEPVAAALMRVLDAAGAGPRALRVYAAMRARLIAELGTEPGTGLREAHRAVLAAGPSRPAAAAAPDPAAFARSSQRADPAPPAQLPADVLGFTGRDSELVSLSTMLAGPGRQATAVVIAGSGGVGKTAIAVRWAHQIAENYPDGQLFIDLRGYSADAPVQPVDALGQFLRALGVEGTSVPVDVQEASAMYRSRLSGKRVLVVLDNARTAEQVRPLLPGAVGSLVLVTSRDTLTGLVARDGARRIGLEVLGPDEAYGLLSEVLGVGRAEAEPEATAELARVCAFLPLALRIAAAKLTDHPARSIQDHVGGLRRGDRLTALAVEDDEHAAVRAVFKASYTTLSPDAQRMFRLLGLVPGPRVNAAAAAALARTSPEEAEHLLERLARAHLVGRQAPGWFAFHDLLGLYAGELALAETSSKDRESAIRRLLDYYLHTAAAANRSLARPCVHLPLPDAASGASALTFADHATALGWFEADRLNLVAAVTYAGEHGLHQPAWLLADAVRGYLHLRAHTLDWVTVARAGLAAATAGRHLQGQAAAQLSLAEFHWRQNQCSLAIDHATQSLRLSEQVGWVEASAAALSMLAHLHRDAGQLATAADHAAQALAVNQECGYLAGQALNIGNLGITYWVMGRLEQAAAKYRQALTLFRELRYPVGEAVNLANLGEVLHALGHYDSALEHLNTALALHQELGDRRFEAEAVRLLATVHRDRGHNQRAREFAELALNLARDAGDRRAETEALNTLGTVHLHLGDGHLAIDRHRQGLALARDAGYRRAEAQALVGLAAAHQHLSQADQAIAKGQEALALCQSTGYGMLEAEAMTILAATFLARREVDRATATAEEALALHRHTGHRLGEARTHLLLGHASRHRHALDTAQTHWQEAQQILIAIGSPEAARVPTMLDQPALSDSSPR